MAAEIRIALAETATKGRYVARMDGTDEVGELTFSKANPQLVIADHTYVPDSMRGTGVGQMLVERLVADARKGGYRIMPLCPFVKAQYARHPEWSDVIQG